LVWDGTWVVSFFTSQECGEPTPPLRRAGGALGGRLDRRTKVGPGRNRFLRRFFLFFASVYSRIFVVVRHVRPDLTRPLAGDGAGRTPASPLRCECSEGFAQRRRPSCLWGGVWAEWGSWASGMRIQIRPGGKALLRCGWS